MLRHLLARLALRRRRTGFHSRFGGLWTDREDAREQLAQRRVSGLIDEGDARLLEHWMEHGFVVLEGAVPAQIADALAQDVERAWSELDQRLLVELGGDVRPLWPKARGARAKLLDLYVHSANARAAAFAPALAHFLELVFERPPHLFQSLSFERGSEQPIHQDTAFVVTTSPLEFAAAWIALEDIEPGSGELTYYRGSHRLPEHMFPGGTRNWNRKRHGDACLENYLAALHTRAAALGLALERFLPKKGDVLVWSADLAHGGSPITQPSQTRKSFVAHYTPRGVSPYSFATLRDRRTIVTHADVGCYSSSHYDLR